MNVILLGANNPKLVGEVVTNLLLAGNAIEVEGVVVAETLLAQIRFAKPVNAETRAVKKAWAAKLEAAKNEVKKQVVCSVCEQVNSHAEDCYADEITKLMDEVDS